jgi:hypothetical protein
MCQGLNGFWSVLPVFCLVFLPILRNVLCLYFVWYFHKYYGMYSACLLSCRIFTSITACTRSLDVYILICVYFDALSSFFDILYIFFCL